MTLPLRTTSLDPVQIPGWRWQPFLDYHMRLGIVLQKQSI